MRGRLALTTPMVTSAEVQMAGPTFDPEKSYILDCTVTALILKNGTYM